MFPQLGHENEALTEGLAARFDETRAIAFLPFSFLPLLCQGGRSRPGHHISTDVLMGRPIIGLRFGRGAKIPLCFGAEMFSCWLAAAVAPDGWLVGLTNR